MNVSGTLIAGNVMELWGAQKAILVAVIAKRE
jgi:hypothetical protein